MAQPPLVLALVLLAALLHAVWNALIKSGEDATLTTTAIFLTGSAVCAAGLPFVDVPTRESWPFLAAGIVLHNGYVLFLVLAYRLGDLSHVYPLARGSAPLLVALVSGPVIGEPLAANEMAGVAIVSLGAIAPIAALRETSTVLAAAIGTLLLGEPFGRRRLAAAALVAAGVVVLNL